MSLGFFTLGCLFLVAGVAYLAHLMQVPQGYAMGSVVILIAIAAVTGLQQARRHRI
ncbi:MAG: hypothetical protein ABR910_02300 [Acidobacteriaceae bacterium]|jgi:hypothetical protein